MLVDFVMDRRIWATAGLAAAGGVLTLAVLTGPAHPVPVTVSAMAHPTETPQSHPFHLPGTGAWSLPAELSPGVYRTAGSPDADRQCVWQRSTGVDQETLVDSGVADPGVPQTVAVAFEDSGFRSQDCGTWTRVR